MLCGDHPMLPLPTLKRATQTVQGQIPGDAVEPGFEVSGRAQAARVLVGAKKSRLDQVFRPCPVTRRPIEVTKDAAFTAVEKFGKGIRVPR